AIPSEARLQDRIERSSVRASFIGLPVLRHTGRRGRECRGMQFLRAKSCGEGAHAATRPMLTPEERSLIFRACWSHPVVRCSRCDGAFRMTELATDLFRGLSHLCRNCLVDLTESVREHLISCAEATRLDAENVRAKARALHEKRALPSARRLNDFMMRPALLEPKPRRRARRKPKSRRLASGMTSFRTHTAEERRWKSSRSLNPKTVGAGRFGTEV